MSTRTITGTAIGSSLTLLRTPLDLATRVLGRRVLVADALDAAVREQTGRLIGDRRLEQDGARRRLATAERRRADHLRSRAEAVTSIAEEQAEERQGRARATRRRADQVAAKRKQAAARTRQTREQSAAERERDRKQAADAAAAKKREAAEDRERRERLAALDDTAVALKERDKALVAEDEAERLQAAAARVKAERKG